MKSKYKLIRLFTLKINKQRVQLQLVDAHNCVHLGTHTNNLYHYFVKNIK